MIKRSSVIFNIVFVLWFLSCKPDKQIIDCGELDYIGDTAFFSNERFSGICIEYYSSGQIKTEKEYLNGVQNGLIRKFFKSGQIKNEGKYLHDSLNGVFKSWYENGQFKEQYISFNGIRSGRHIEYYESGQQKSEGSYFNNRIDVFQPQKTWYTNGQLETEIKKLKNKKGLLQIFYNENGSKKFEFEFYNYGFDNSIFRAWDSAGTVCEGSFKEFLYFQSKSERGYKGYEFKEEDLKEFKTPLRDSAYKTIMESKKSNKEGIY